MTFKTLQTSTPSAFHHDEIMLDAYIYVGKLKNQNQASRLSIVRQTARELRDMRGVSLRVAVDAASKALCEWESAEVPEFYIDVDSSTSFCLVVNDAALGVKRYLSLKDICALVDRNNISMIKTDHGQLVALN